MIRFDLKGIKMIRTNHVKTDEVQKIRKPNHQDEEISSGNSP